MRPNRSFKPKSLRGSTWFRRWPPAIEAGLLEQLFDALPHTTQRGDMLFFSSAFHPEYIRPHQISERSELLYSLANESVALREQIGLPVIGSSGQLFLSACSGAASMCNVNRREPRLLAAWLQDELGPNHSLKPNLLRGSA